MGITNRNEVFLGYLLAQLSTGTLRDIVFFKSNVTYTCDKVIIEKPFELTSEMLKEQIKNIPYKSYYSTLPERNDYAVENEEFPSMLFSYYSYLFAHGCIPTPEEFVNNYFRLYSNKLRGIGKDFVLYKGKRYSKDAIKKRIARAYPSVTRDIFFYLLLTEEGCFDEVTYSVKRDIEGVDVAVKHNGKEYQISLFWESNDSNGYKEVKSNYRHQLGSSEIKMPLVAKQAELCGDIFLYTRNDVEEVKRIIL